MKQMISIYVILLLAYFSYGQTNIPTGLVHGTWTVNESPFFIDGDIDIPLDSSLIIEAGVEVIFQGPYYFNVYGSLQAIGTASDSIYFTIHDNSGFDDLEDYNQGWRGIHFRSGNESSDSSLIKYAVIEYCCPSSAPTWADYSEGSIYVESGHWPQVAVENSWIRNNRIYIHSYCGDLNLINNIISDNIGGGFLSILNTGTIYGNIITGNQSYYDIDIGGLHFNSVHRIYNNMICFNSAYNGGGVSVSEDGGQLDIYNSILYGNETNSGMGSMAYGYWSIIGFHHCIMDGTYHEDGNLVAEYHTAFDDLFSDTSSSFYNLSTNSVAIDSGLNEIIINSEPWTHPEFDILGNPRIINDQIDIGAIETSLTHGIINNALPKIKLYPNPVKEMVCIDLSCFSSSELSIQIIDMKGKMIRKALCSNGINYIDVSTLKRGLYIINMLSEERNESSLLIKE